MLTEVVPAALGVAARGWDEQHLDLAAAAAQLGRCSGAGFLNPTSAALTRFLSAWEQHTLALAAGCESLADGLRAALHDYLDNDALQGFRLLQLTAFGQEQR